MVPAADPRSLVPPLLACLPLALASLQPPSSLLHLLSPILRQRLQLFSATETSSGSWLSLLCWDPSESAKLMEIVGNNSFEPHPVSGEVELGDVPPLQYRRLDEETLHSKVQLVELGLVIVYLWCEVDHVAEGCGWRVSEIQPYPYVDSSQNMNQSWWNTTNEANQAFRTNHGQLIKGSGIAQDKIVSFDASASVDEKAEDDEDYWAQYDKTPARTPAIKRFPAPRSNHDQTGCNSSTTSDAEYYAQYEQVQPAMENHDPLEEHLDVGQSSLEGNEVLGAMTNPELKRSQPTYRLPSDGKGQDTIVHTGLSSSASSTLAVARLEESAIKQSHGEIAVQQHISSSLKSLFRLSRGKGIGRQEFERLVRNELDTLSMLMDDN
ncbi:hypothetical protein MMC13_007927 [Lambiella insularis]|nr:hypothetical protein [Lambiella insularis]